MSDDITDINEYRALKAKRAHCAKVNELLRTGCIKMRSELAEDPQAAMRPLEDAHNPPKWMHP